VRIGIVCYASTGGSGIVATELAVELAQRGHDVHVLSTEPPFRFPQGQRGLAFHEVATPAYVVPLGDSARMLKKEHMYAKKAEIVWNN